MCNCCDARARAICDRNVLGFADLQLPVDGRKTCARRDDGGRKYPSMILKRSGPLYRELDVAASAVWVEVAHFRHDWAILRWSRVPGWAGGTVNRRQAVGGGRWQVGGTRNRPDWAETRLREMAGSRRLQPNQLMRE
jgi:hypothetical protein